MNSGETMADFAPFRQRAVLEVDEGMVFSIEMAMTGERRRRTVAGRTKRKARDVHH